MRDIGCNSKGTVGIRIPFRCWPEVAGELSRSLRPGGDYLPYSGVVSSAGESLIQAFSCSLCSSLNQSVGIPSTLSLCFQISRP